jgi:ribonucleoside-diphosphate reductase beta chain
MEVSSPDKIFRKIRTSVSLYNISEKDSTTTITNNVDTDSGVWLHAEHEPEPLLREDSTRFCLFPIQYHDIWKAYKDHKNAFWTAEEIDFTCDKGDWKKLTDNERYFIEHILAFFAGSDGIVLENLMKNFCSEVQIPEARCFYGFQAMMENIHSEVYSLMIDSFVQDPKRKEHLFDAIHTIPCIEKKANWALQWINDKEGENSFGRRLFAFGIVEGLFFSGAFCAIFWLKERGLMTQTLGKSNEWIARDESLHTEFAILLYTNHVLKKLDEVEAHNIMHQAVQIEEEFICDSLTVQLIGMDPVQMKQYVRYCADRLLNQFGYKKMYYDKNPFPFMEKIAMDGKTNFFEQRVSEYSLVSGGGNNDVSSSAMFVLEDLENEVF